MGIYSIGWLYPLYIIRFILVILQLSHGLSVGYDRGGYRIPERGDPGTIIRNN